MSQPTASQQLAGVREQLLQALCKKADAEAAVAQHQETIIALRNVLSGIPLGKALAAEATPAQEPAPPAQ